MLEAHQAIFEMSRVLGMNAALNGGHYALELERGSMR
jgi:hypothetical protein